MEKEFLTVGKIVGTHGVRGMVRIEPWSDSPEFLCDFKKFYIENGENEITALKVIPHGRMVIAAFCGINSIEDAEKYRGKLLLIRRSDAKLPENKYFIDELLKSEVYDADTNELLGIITDVFKTGANDVWQVSKDNKDYLLPVIDEVVKSVDIKTGKVTVKPLKGIFDDEN